jgi:hypothetical protein
VWKKRSPQFKLFVLVASVVSGLLRYAEQPPERSPSLPLTCADAEVCFALGIPLPLKDADEFALQLIPKVGDSVSQSILTKKGQVCAAAARLPSRESWRAFLVAKGVGPALAKELDKFIAVAPYSQCTH